MCFDQPYCVVPYIMFVHGEPVVAVHVSLITRERASAVYTTLAAEWLPDCDSWSVWTACDFPSVLGPLGIPSTVAPVIMEEVTDLLAESPVVTIHLDGGLLTVTLLPASAVIDD